MQNSRFRKFTEGAKRRKPKILTVARVRKKYDCFAVYLNKLHLKKS